MKAKLRLRFYLTESLVRDMLKGDKHATMDLLSKIRENCIMYLSREDAEDVAQEILLAMYNSGVASGRYASTICQDKIINSLIGGMLEGDGHATSILLSLVYEDCWAQFSRSTYFSEQDAEDMAQEILIAIYNSRVASGSYASRICRNKRVNAWKERKRERRVFIPSSPGREFSADEDTEQVRETAICPPVQLESMIEQEMLKKKDSIQQKLLYEIKEIGNSLPAGALEKGWQALRYQLDGLTHEQIRVKMGAKSVGTVKSWISRYRNAYLTNQLVKRGWSPDDFRLAMGY